MTERSVPKYQQIADLLRSGIRDGIYLVGLPTHAELHEQFGVSLSVTTRAFAVLRGEGLISEGSAGRRRRVLAQPEPVLDREQELLDLRQTLLTALERVDRLISD